MIFGLLTFPTSCEVNDDDEDLILALATGGDDARSGCSGGMDDAVENDDDVTSAGDCDCGGGVRDQVVDCCAVDCGGLNAELDEWALDG